MKAYLTIIFFSFACILWAQKNIIKLEVDQKRIKLGESLVITVRSNIEGEISIDFPPEFVRGYDVMSGMEQVVDYNSGIVNTINYYSQNGSFKKVGTFTIGPAYIKRGKHVYKSNTVQVTIQKENIENSNGSITNKQLKQVAFGVIEVDKSTLYEGEPLVVQAKVFSKFAPTSIEDYQSYKIEQSIDKHNLGNGQNLTAKREQVKGNSLYVISHDRSLVFPSGGGTLQIRPFKLILRQNFDGVAVISTGTSITVKPLPNNAPKSFIGMVGQLEAACKFNGSCSKKGDILKVELVLSGKGNLHNIEPPILKLSKGLIQFGKPEIIEEFTFGNNGAEGRMIVNYTIQSTNNEVKSINDILISYFNPQKEAYITLTLSGFKSNEIQENKTIEKKGSTTIMKKTTDKNEQSIQTSSDNVIPWGIASLVSVLSIAFVGVYFIRKKPTIPKDEIIKSPIIISNNLELNKDEVIQNFERAINHKNFTQLERAIFELLFLALKTNNTPTLNKESLMDQLKSLNNEHYQVVFNWHQSIQQVTYGLNVAGTDHEHLISTSMHVRDIILTNYITS